MAFAAAMALMLPSTAALASPVEISPTRITRLAVQSDGLVFVKVEPSTPTGGTPASCATNSSWQLTFHATDAAGQAMLAAALSAKASGSQVGIVTAGTCTHFPFIEDARLIDILP